MTATPAGLDAWLPGFVAHELQPAQIDEWVARTAETIRADLPEVAAQPDLVEALSKAVREHWLAFLAAFPQASFHYRLVDAGVDLAREAAAHGLPIESLIKIYRLAQQASWTYVTGVVSAIPADEIDHTGVLIYFWTRASAWIDESIGASTTIFSDERARRMQGASAQRYEAVQQLLVGEIDDPVRASASLGGYPLTATHTAMILETNDAARIGDLDRFAQEIARELGARPLSVHPGGRQLWVWVASRDLPDLSKIDAARLKALDAYAVVGASAVGIEGFALSHRDAQRTLAVAATGGPWLPVMRYEDVELVALLGCNEDVDRFVERTLGGLSATDESTRRVCETVAAFLRNGANVDAAASELFVHRNTIRYRLRNAEALLGRPITNAGDHLLLAIQHRELFHAGG